MTTSSAYALRSDPEKGAQFRELWECAKDLIYEDLQKKLESELQARAASKAASPTKLSRRTRLG